MHCAYVQLGFRVLGFQFRSSNEIQIQRRAANGLLADRVEYRAEIVGSRTVSSCYRVAIVLNAEIVSREQAEVASWGTDRERESAEYRA
ncbi:hypothetical protein DY000_02018746 [Brassica cretica]|uniref:Uncharacterized protein n=1 Tax=Brassica cretica TaxID=69181 RepID=A0ABQ7CXH4_BRACR|nr:hypothetical protein DY000_02018746 [Brassica cretica]